jgi:RNA polymerase sigma-70 factor (ECF subfamily)
MNYASLSANELARVCSQSDDAEAWNEFVRRFNPTINLVVWRVARRYREFRPAVIEGLVQDTYFKFLADDRRRLREFEPRHEDAFYGMVKVVATNLVHDYFRKYQPDKEETDLSEIEAIVPSTSSGPKQIQHGIQMREIEEALLSITASSSSDERDRGIFWLHHRYGFTAKQIASIRTFRLTDKGVESILHRLMLQLRKRLTQDRTPEEMPEETPKKGG